MKVQGGVACLPLKIKTYSMLRVEYRPLPFVIGAWVSSIAWIGFGGLLGFVFLRRRKIGDLQG